LVKSVARGSVGDALGLRGGTVPVTIMGEQLVVGGDIILKVQGQPVGDVADHRRVRDILDAVPPGGAFAMTVLRLGQVIELKGRHPWTAPWLWRRRPAPAAICSSASRGCLPAARRAADAVARRWPRVRPTRSIVRSPSPSRRRGRSSWRIDPRC